MDRDYIEINRGGCKLNTKTNDKWNNWSELLFSYKNSRLPLEEFISEEKQVHKKNVGIDKVVSLEIARSMKRDLLEIEKELQSRIMYAMNSMKQEDMKAAGLTVKEIKIASLRQEYSNARVAEILSVDKSYVWRAYQSAVEKVLKYKILRQNEKVLYRLSPQQKEIVKLLDQGKSQKEILDILGITLNNLKMQKNKIKKKLGVPKTVNFQQQVKCAQN